MMVAAGAVGVVAAAWAGSVGLMLQQYGRRLRANLDRGATSSG